MAERRFNPLDPLGLFSSRESLPPGSPELRDRRQGDINRFLLDIRKQIPDEAQAHAEYVRLSNEASRLGFTEVSRTLLQISQDESRHGRELQDISIKTW